MVKDHCGLVPLADLGHHVGGRSHSHVSTLSHLLYFSLSLLGRNSAMWNEGDLMRWFPTFNALFSHKEEPEGG